MDWIALVALVISAFAFFVGLLFSWRSDKRTKLDTLKAYYEEGGSPQITKLVKELYKQISKGPFERSEFHEVGELLNFFDKWATLCLNGYLPIWIFKGNPGHTLIVFHEYTKGYIHERRAQEALGNVNSNYALAIEKLAKKIKKKYFK